MAECLYPPHSRLYIACDRETTLEELTNAFRPFGKIHNINLCRDRTTGQPKGFAFIQFDKTSEAAAAIEALNGKTVGQSSRPIKVIVALTKEQSSAPGSSDPSQYLRLFLVVPKTATENDLREYFSQFGDIDTVSIVKDRETRESKGYAYVKYKRFLDAAVAFENCDPQYKVIFAKPKEHSGRVEQASSSQPSLACTHIDDNPEGYTALRVMISSELTDEQVEWLLDIPPGLEFVRFFTNPPVLGYDAVYRREVVVQYDSPGTAAYALRKLEGFEYPAGMRLMVKPDFQFIGRQAPGAREVGPKAGSKSVTELMQQVEKLTRSLAEVTKIVEMAGIRVPQGKTVFQLDSLRCSAKLPPPQPLAPPNSVCQERLFLVCEPGLPPQDALWDVFGRFGNLIDLYILSGKNCGYAKYTDRNSALKAMETLNGQDLYRMRMKVMIAEPHQPGDRKRPRKVE